MKAIKTVGVKALKDRLSEYLRLVKAGTRVLVTEHENVIAEIVLPDPSSHHQKQTDVLDEWVRAGRITLGKGPRKKLKRLGFNSPEGTSKESLDWTRGDR